MRLFVAVTPPPSAIAHLTAAVETMAGTGATPATDVAARAGPRWVRPVAWHLTLAFLGSVGENQIAELTVRLARAAARHAPFELSIAGGGRFGDRVLWAGIAGDRRALVGLAASVGAAARRTGIALDERPYRPHLTLARGAPGVALPPLAEALRAYVGPSWLALRPAPHPEHPGCRRRGQRRARRAFIVVARQGERAGMTAVEGALVIRRARLADVPAIVALLADDELSAAREDLSDPLFSVYTNAFEAIDADPANFLAVGELAGLVVATMQVTVLHGLSRRGSRRALIEAVRVSAEHRGAGLGGELVAWAIELARERGCRVVQLTTDKRRTGAHRFYARLGFVASHEGMKLVLDPR